MRTRLLVALNMGLVVGLVLALSQPWASGATTHHLTLPVGAFLPRSITDRNNAITPACAAAIVSQPGNLARGRLTEAEGAFVESVNVPSGATITALNLFATDSDTDAGIDVHAFLFRKRIADGLSPEARGFGAMAHAASSGGVADTMRKFSDATIDNPVVDNAKFEYYVELDICQFTIEPAAVQIVYSI
jgi:hypothetical protein